MKFRFTHIFRSNFYFLVIIIMMLTSAPQFSFAQESDDDSESVVEDFSDEQESVHQNIFDTTRDVTTLRSVPDTAVRRLKEDKNFAYANDSAYWKKARPSEQDEGLWSTIGSFARSGLARALFYMVIVGFLLFVFYQVIIVNRLYIFSSSTRAAKQEEELAEESFLSKEQLEQRLSAAVADSDYRLAVRFLYLITLFGLKERGLITVNANTTNHELIDQLARRKDVKEFSQLAQVYEYVWYGEFKLTEEQYSKVSRGYRDFQNSIKI
jgi:hypothetical protein